MAEPILLAGDRFEPELRSALISAFENIRARINTSVVAQIIESPGQTSLMDMLRPIEQELSFEFNDVLNNAITEGGRVTTQIIPKQGLLTSTFRFDILSPVSIDFIRNYQLNLISTISENTREAIRNFIQNSILTGMNPRTTAIQLRDVIGLAAGQERALRNYRTELEVVDTNALSRELVIGHDQEIIREAARLNKNLTQTQINTLVGNYRERLINFRAESISRTESLRAVTIGNQSAVDQLIAQNGVDTERVRKFWRYTQDARTRIPHRQIPGLNPLGVRLNGFFKTPLGPMRFPRDPNGTAANVIKCRCIQYFRFLTNDQFEELRRTHG